MTRTDDPPTDAGRALEVFVELGRIDPAARSLRLAELDAAEPRVAARVRAMLAADDRRHDLLDAPAGTNLVGRAMRSVTDGTVDFAPRRFGAFELLGELGSGATGTVHRARSAGSGPGPDVALKILNHVLVGPRGIARFRREAELLARLEHPGIARIREAGALETAAGRQPWIAMELVEGVPLTEWTRPASGPPKSTRAIVEAMVQVAEAVAHAHAHGIVHRDLKPANVLVRPDGRPVVLDLGAGRLHEDDPAAPLRTETGQIIGTIPYMAPEQFSGHPGAAGPPADVYALGAIAYRLLTGRLPLENGGLPLAEAARMTREDEPTSLGARVRALRGPLSAVIGTALAKRPDHRYPDAAGFAEDLRRWLGGDPVAAKAPALLVRLRRSAVRNRTVLVGTAAIVVLAASVTSISVILATGARRLAAADARAAETARVGRDAAEALRDDALFEAAVGGLAAAESAIRHGDAAESRARIERIPAAYRGWLSDHLAARADGSDALWPVTERRLEAATPLGEDLGHFAAVEFGEDSGVHVVRRAAHDVLEGLPWMNDAAWHEGTGRLAVGGWRGLRIFDLETGTPILTLPAALPVRRLAFTADGRRLMAVCVDGSMRWWAVETGGLEHEVRADVTADLDDSVILPDLEEGWSITATDVVRLHRDGSETVLHRPGGQLSALAVSADGRRFAVGNYGGAVTVLDRAGEIVATPDTGLSDQIRALTWVGPDAIVASASRTMVLALDGTGPRPLVGYGGTAVDHFVQAGHVVVTSTDGSVRGWRIGSAPRPLEVPHPRQVRRVTWLDDGRVLTGGGRHPTADGRVRVVRAADGGVERVFEPALDEIGWLERVPGTPDRILAAALGGIAMWTESGALDWRTREPATTAITVDVAGSPVIVAGAYFQPARLLDPATGATIFTWPEETESVLAAVDLGDGTCAALNSGGRLLRLDLVRRTIRDDLDLGPAITLVGVPPAGGSIDDPPVRLIVAGRDSTLAEVDVAGWAVRRRLEDAQAAQHALAVVPSASIPGDWDLLSGGEDRVLRWWSLERGRTLGSLAGHTGRINGVAASPGGTWIGTVGDDRSLRLWCRGTADGRDAGLGVRAPGS